MNFKTMLKIGIIIAGATLTLGCGSTYDITTPSEMVAVEKSDREYVAMTHDGIVLRALVHEQGDTEDVGVAGRDFWVQSVRERMRTRGGYALLEEREVRSLNGVEGTQLEFGRDQDGVAYLYLLTLFVTEENVHVLDAGGRQDQFEEARDAIDRALATYIVEE